MFVTVAVGLAALITLSSLAAVGAFNGNAAVPTNCAAKPSSCGYPDATNTGVPAGTTLKSVPSPGLQRAGLALQCRDQGR